MTRWSVAAFVLLMGTTAGSESPVWLGIVREDGLLMPVVAITPALFERAATREPECVEMPIPGGC
jgi:hypothetical protein